MPVVSIIIINYKSCKLVMDCIQSIVEQTSHGLYEIIVVDNDSQDGAKAIILKKYPEVQWIEMGYNAGFSRANNAGMRIAKGDFFLILNSDTIILNRAIDKSISLIQNQPDAVGGGVQLLNTDGTNQISGAHFVKGGLNALLPLPYLGKLIRYIGYRFKTTIPSVKEVKKDIEVDWIVGAYFLVRKNVIKKAGLFDEDFFIYAEEIEWCARLRKHGKLILFAEPKVVHLKGGTSSEYYDTKENENGENLWNKKARQIIISNMLRIRKQYGVGYFLLNSGLYIFDVPVFFVCLIFSKIIPIGKTKYNWEMFANFCKNIFVLLQYFFKILKNKPHFYKVS